MLVQLASLYLLTRKFDILLHQYTVMGIINPVSSSLFIHEEAFFSNTSIHRPFVSLCDSLYS